MKDSLQSIKTYFSIFVFFFNVFAITQCATSISIKQAEQRQADALEQIAKRGCQWKNQ